MTGILRPAEDTMASACTLDRLGQGAISINDSIFHSFNNTVCQALCWAPGTPWSPDETKLLPLWNILVKWVPERIRPL